MKAVGFNEIDQGKRGKLRCNEVPAVDDTLFMSFFSAAKIVLIIM